MTKTAMQKLTERLAGMNVETITPTQFCSLIDNLHEDEFQALAAMLDEYRRPLPSVLPRTEAIDSVQAVNEIEEHVLRLLEELERDSELAVDRRFLAIGRTQIELGFMAVCRAILKPGRYVIDPASAPEIETGWVLEREDSPPAEPLYYSPSDDGHQPQWSRDDLVAIRFAREIDASRLAAALGVQVRVCEHQWWN